MANIAVIKGAGRKFGFISDPHANLPALKAVVAGLKKQRVDEIYGLGDFVGYGSRPNECVELIRSEQIFCLKGNHDAAASDTKITTHFNPIALRAIKWTANRLLDENKKFLSSLPIKRSFELEGGDVVELVHGSLLNPLNGYIREMPEIVGNFGAMSGRYLIFGHTHRPSVYFTNKLGSHLPATFRNTPQLELSAFTKYLINPGSVGQPRDGDPRASFMIFDEKSRGLEIFRVDYDVAAAQRDILNSGLDQKAAAALVKRLALGL
jgi:predicted phosphodiesterase